MKMVYKLLLVFTCIVLLTLCACGGQTPTPPNEGQTDAPLSQGELDQIGESAIHDGKNGAIGFVHWDFLRDLGNGCSKWRLLDNILYMLTPATESRGETKAIPEERLLRANRSLSFSFKSGQESLAMTLMSTSLCKVPPPRIS